MSRLISLEHFEGPLDLLLQLIEAEKLEITDVSLRLVTEPFVRQLEEHRGDIPLDELADFLLVAAKLIYLKSKALLPTFTDPALDEGPDLAAQLRAYQAFVKAAEEIQEIWKQGRRSFGRSQRPRPERVAGFFPPKQLSADQLHEAYERVVRRLEPLRRLPKAAVERMVTIEEKIQHLRERVSRQLRTSFTRILSEAHDRHELVVTFLALLELLKQRHVRAEQGELFSDIHLQSSS